MKTPAAFLLFAALLGVTRADASLPKAADVADLSRPALRLPAVASTEPSRFGFAEDLSLLAPESTPGRFGLFGLETCRFERTYARNNPVRYYDPDGREVADGVQLREDRDYALATGGPAGLASFDRASTQGLGYGLLAIGALATFGGGGGLVGSFLGTHPTLAGWLGAIGLGMVGAAAPAPQAILQGVTNTVSGELAANPALAKTVLSQAQYAAGQGSAGVARMQYGNAIEGLVAQQIQASPALSQMFRHVGGPNRPDLVGRIGSEAVGMTFDVTTKTAAAAHQTRPYGLGLQLITYERSETFRLFPPK